MSSADDARLSAAQRAWVEAFAPRVPSIARSLRSSFGDAALDDCEGAGYEALVRAALRYDPDKGVPFPAYAFYRVRGAMLDAARRSFPERRPGRRALHVLAVTQALAEAQARPPGDPRDLLERTRAAAELVQDVRAVVLLSRAFAGAREGDEDEDEADDEVPLDAETRLSLRALVERCPADDRALVDAIYVRGLTMTEYAAEQRTSVSTVSRRHQRLLRRFSDLLSGREPAADDLP